MKNSKLITLPSGASVKIRKLCAKDFLRVGNIPDVHAAGEPKGERPGSNEFAVKLTEIILTECIGPISLPGGNMRVVQKAFYDCTDTEVSVEEFMSTPDSLAIVTEVCEFSGMSPAAKEAARPFPEEQAARRNGSSAGPALSGSTVGAPLVAG